MLFSGYTRSGSTCHVCERVMGRINMISSMLEWTVKQRVYLTHDSSNLTPHAKNQPPAPPRLRRLTDLAEAESAFLTLEVYGLGRDMER